MMGNVPDGHPPIDLNEPNPNVSEDYKHEYVKALEKIDFDAVKADIVKLLTDSKDWWPADYGNYGPFMVRQAWHCSGSYRASDGRGGCDGGRQRFEPERSWADNTNLDKTKTLLWPIKQKYGLGLSWGDLIILTGTTAIESMGGPVLGFCAGRIDDFDGSASLELGPTVEQEKEAPCPVQGNCPLPLGTSTIGLIYVNPEGPMGKPIPSASAGHVRDTFARMSMNDAETVALIGGGHAFGKTHGACPKGPGPSPSEDPSNPWPGACGTGKGKDTFTSGFEGAWTTTPTQWSNNYFTELLQNSWEVYKGPGGHFQWRPKNSTKKIMMLTSDISLLNDPEGKYQKYVKLYATDRAAFDSAFSHAWYKLTTRDMGPVTRCFGKDVPPPQPFQNPLPPPPTELPDFDAVRQAIREVMSTSNPALKPDIVQGSAYYGGVFVQLAWQCMSTFRVTDYLGGCNGARIRFPPQSQWSVNVAMDKALQVLQPVIDQFDNLSWADLIVLAGNVALEDATGKTIPFCGGRTDAVDGEGAKNLKPNGDLSASIDQVREFKKLMGLTNREIVALFGRLRSKAQQERSGFSGTWSTNPSELTNEFFKTLLSETWQAYTGPNGRKQFKAQGKNLFMVPSDLAIRWDDEFLAIAQEYASDADLFVSDFVRAWTRLSNIDRFDGPAGNVCSS